MRNAAICFGVGRSGYSSIAGISAPVPSPIGPWFTNKSHRQNFALPLCGNRNTYRNVKEPLCSVSISASLRGPISGRARSVSFISSTVVNPSGKLRSRAIRFAASSKAEFDSEAGSLHPATNAAEANSKQENLILVASLSMGEVSVGER